MKKYLLYLICFGMLFLKNARAQDVHFSQYYLSPLTLNPANTGNFKGDYRFFGNYRSQWRDISKAYNTFSAGGDMNFFPKNLNFAGGFMIVNDKSGGNLSVTKIMPSAAFHKKLFGFNLHAGIQAGLVIKAIDFYANSFPDQLNWNTGKFDNTLPNNETGVVQRHTFLDINMGIAASRRFGKFEPDIGIAFSHLNKPKDSFLGESNRLPVRQLYNAGLSYYFTRSVILKALTMYDFTTAASDWVSGFHVEYVLTRDAYFANSVYAGFMWRDGFKRNTDAGIITCGLNYSHYTIGFSYDITFSQLKTSVDSKGAFEIAFIYRAKSTRLIKKTIPCERY